MNPCNLLSLILTILLHLIPSSISRGPHHPQGSHVVKRHTHYTPVKTNEKLTQDSELLQDKQHIQVIPFKLVLQTVTGKIFRNIWRK